MCRASVLILTFLCVVATADNPLPALPPMDGWTLRAPATDFPAGEVYKVIDGEVELFLPYGLKQARFADYTGPENVTLSTECYEMGSAVDAYGIFTRCRSPRGKMVAIGAYGSATSTQIVFCKGHYFVRASVSTRSDSAHNTLLSWAKAVATPIADETLPPASRFMRLPVVVPGTDQYFAKDLLELGILPGGYQAEVTLGDERKCLLFVVPAADESAVLALKNALTEKLTPVETSPYAGGMHATLKGMLYDVRGSLLVGLARLDAPAQGVSLLENLLIGASASQTQCGACGLGLKKDK